MNRAIDAQRASIKRHGFSGRFVHWTVALSTVVLIISGLGQLPLFKRYFVDTLPGLAWTSDFGVTLQLHYLAAAALTLAVVYHVVYHTTRREFDIVPRRGDLRESYQIIKAMFGRGEEPDSDKYLAEQRVAYAFIGGAILLVIATGYLKAVKNLPGVELPYWLLWTTTTLHNLAMFLIILGIGGHLAAFLIKENRALLPGMFTGRVSLAYAQKRHCLWCDGLDLSAEDGVPGDSAMIPPVQTRKGQAA